LSGASDTIYVGVDGMRGGIIYAGDQEKTGDHGEIDVEDVGDGNEDGNATYEGVLGYGGV
jgi:hypothetical protein